jgi:tripartite ATP-independent transporter DctM subunit
MEIDLFLVGIIVASLVLVFLGYAISFALGGTALVYLLVNDFPVTVAVQELALSVRNFTMLAIPLFMFTGQLMNASKITDRIFDFANDLVGRIPGGLGHVNIVASLIFAGMSGSVLADVAGLGAMEVKAMRDKGYDTDFAVGVTLSSASIGPILPPSVPLVLFGVIAEVSITGLFLGGILPGLLIALTLMVYVYFIGRKRGYYVTERTTLGRLGLSFIRAFPALMTPVIIVGGMTLGIFSPTEAATVAVLYALFLGFVFYRDLTWEGLFDVSRETVLGTSRLLFVIANALLFGWVLTVGEMPQQAAHWVSTTFSSTWAFLLLLNVSLLILGAIIENAILLLILAPMIVPIAEESFGLDPLHIGVVMVFNIMIGQFTPPMGMSLFIMRGITGLSLSRISIAVAPFLIPLVTALLIMTFVPQVVLFVPRALGF